MSSGAREPDSWCSTRSFHWSSSIKYGALHGRTALALAAIPFSGLKQHRQNVLCKYASALKICLLAYLINIY